MTGEGELHTVELSRGKPRLTAPRPSDLGTVETAGDRDRDHGNDGRFVAGNRAAVGRSARRALTAPLRAAQRRVADAAQGQAAPVADALLGDALAVYGSVRVELGSRSVLVLGPAVTYATETVLAGWFVRRAAETGLDTEEGARLLGLAHACETQATRALTAALAAAKAVGARRKPDANRLLDAIEAAGHGAEEES